MIKNFVHPPNACVCLFVRVSVQASWVAAAHRPFIVVAVCVLHFFCVSQCTRTHGCPYSATHTKQTNKEKIKMVKLLHDTKVVVAPHRTTNRGLCAVRMHCFARVLIFTLSSTHTHCLTHTFAVKTSPTLHPSVYAA